MGGKTISTETQKIASIQLQTSAYGLVIAFGYGTNRVSGNLIWYGNFTPIAHTTKTASGGKGMGKVTQKDTSYTYQAALMMALGEGTIAGVRSVWKGKDKTTLAALGLTLFTGAPTQAAWSYLTSYVGASGTAAYENTYGFAGQAVTFNQPALAYSCTAYLASASYDLGEDASIPNHGFEVQWPYILAGKDDANPAAFVTDFLTSQQYGAGFPAASIGNLAPWSSYALAAGLLFSPAYTEARSAADCLTELTDASNTAIVWSEGLLKFVPYGDSALTGNGATFTPNTTPLYDLTDDAFLAEDDTDPIIVTRSTPADAFNRVQVEFLNRANQYNVEIVTVEDQQAIEAFGLKVAPILQMHFICDPVVAKIAAQLALQRYLYKRNTYTFQLGWQYDLLEPMDLVTVTDAALGLATYPVRVIAVEEDDAGTLSITAEDFPLGIASATQYPHDSGQRYQAQLNAKPSSAAAPIIFELPADPSATGLSVALAAGGQTTDPLYGGCRVWLSLDGSNYKAEGIIYGSSRYGLTSASLAAAPAGTDTTNSLGLALRSNGQMLSGSATDRSKGTTLLNVGGEYLAYQTATLTGTNAYNLTSLNRGLYGTASGAHASGSTWVRIDDAIAVLKDLDLTLIGQTIYIKVTAFNTYGAGEQDLADVSAYTYTITGVMKALETPVDFATQVAGTTKPENNATAGVDTLINGDGADGTLNGWAVTGGTATPGSSGSLTNVAETVGRSIQLAKTSSGLWIAAATNAVRVNPGDVVAVKARMRAGTAASSGIYASCYWKSSAPAVYPGPIQGSERDSTYPETNFVTNAAVGTSFTDYLGQVTVPPGMYWMSVSATNFVPGTPDLHVLAEAYTRVAGTQQTDLTTGRITSPIGLPPVAAMNLGYKYQGVPTYSAAAGTPATATISIAAANMLLGSVTVAYGALSVGVTGTNGTSSTFQLYVEEPDPAALGGNKTLYATTSGDNIYSGTNRVWLGSVVVAFPASGGGTATGTGGGGSGGGGTRGNAIP